MRLALVVSAIASSLAAVQAADVSGNWCNSVVCVNVYIPSGSTDATVTVQSTASGWAGIGFGTSSMGGSAPALVGWTGSGGAPVASYRVLSDGHAQPPFGAAANLVSAPSASIVSPMNSAQVAFSAVVPARLFPATVNCVWAASAAVPPNRDSPASSFGKHSQEGSFTLNIAEIVASPAAPKINPLPSSTRIQQTASTIDSAVLNLLHQSMLRPSPTTTTTSTTTSSSSTTKLANAPISSATGTAMATSLVAATMAANSLNATSAFTFSSVTPITTTTTTRTLTTAAAQSLSTIAVVNANGTISTFCADKQGTFCLVVTRDDVDQLVTFTMFTSYLGWMGLGTGFEMDGSIMFVAWQNTQDAMVVSQRTATGHNQPLSVPGPSSIPFTILPNPPSSVYIPASAAMSVSFSISSTTPIVSLTNPSSFIWAVSNSRPTKPNDPTSNFAQHDLKGVFTLDASALESTSLFGNAAVTSGNLQLQQAHGALMFFAWGVVVPLFIFIARYMKVRLGQTWYLLHLDGMLYGLGGLTIAGLVCIELQIPAGQSRFTQSGAHGIIGLLLCFVALPLQCALGFVCNLLFRADRVQVPWWDRVHHWCGRVTLILALVQMQLGLIAHGAAVWTTVLWWIWVVLIGVGLFVGVGEWWLGGASPAVATVAEDSEMDEKDREGRIYEQDGVYGVSSRLREREQFLVAESDEYRYQPPERDVTDYPDGVAVDDRSLDFLTL
ncbi:hypothetical protein BC830DRAFT_1168229 [Chytriomyces sp. MP71]|nr:hypothetical protein BC830DRAFT_1168229 [Chytriomyces sp. MP71]